MKNLKNYIICLIFTFSFNQNIYALDLNKLLKNISDKSQQTNQQQNNKQGQLNTSAGHNDSSGNNFKSQNDPSRESVRKQRTIILAKNSGAPVDIKETLDGKERVGKEDVLIESLSKAVNSVHANLGISSYSYYNTYSEFQRNITSTAYGLINKFDKVEKENVYMMMNQPDSQKNTWSVTINANINTKLSDENYRKIKEDSRIIYTQMFGQTPEQARLGAALNAVQQYHQVSIAPNTPFMKNFMRSDYGLIQKIEILSESQNPYIKGYVSKIKVTLADLGKLDPAKYEAIKRDIEVSKVQESPNPVLIALTDATKEVGAAQSIIENALSIKGTSEIVKQDAYREKAGVRLGENGFQWQVGMNEERWAVIEQRLNDNPKLDEQQKQEFTRGQQAMTPAYLKVIKSAASIFTSLSSGGNPFQSLQALIVFPKVMAANSEGMNSLMTYNSNNGIDNSAMKQAKQDQGD